MTRITSTDQVLLLLRSHLQRAARAGRPNSTGSAETPRKSALERARQIVASEEVSEEDIRGALIAGILTEEFGSAFAGDARFHDIRPLSPGGILPWSDDSIFKRSTQTTDNERIKCR